MLLDGAIGEQGALPVGNFDIPHDNLSAVIHRLGHHRIGCVDIAARHNSLHRKVGDYVGGELEAGFNTHIALVDSVDCEVGECVLQVVEGAHHLGLVIDGGVVCGSAHIPPVAGILPVDVGRECLHCLEVVYDGVARARGEECLIETGRIVEVAQVGIYPLVSANYIIETELPCVGKEFGDLALAVRRHHGAIVLVSGFNGNTVDDEFVSVFIQTREQALPHEAFTPEGLIAGTGAEVGAEIPDCVLCIHPSAKIANLGIVVIAVLVPLMENLGGAMLHIVVEVVLELVGRGCEVALGEVVHVHIIITSEQIRHHFVVFRAVDAGVESAGNGQVVLGTVLEGRGKVEVVLVYMPLLLYVLRAVEPVLVGLDAVHIVETVPVHVSQSGIAVRMCPDLRSPSVLHAVVAVHVRIRIVEVTGKIAVVIRAGILGIVPVECGVAVLAETIERGHIGVELVGRSIIILYYRDGLVGLADAGVAHLSVLVSPVGIVHVVANQVIHFLGGCILGTALAGSGKEDETQLVGIPQHLVRSEVICERTIVHAVDPVVAAQSGRYIYREGPAVVHHAGGI